MSVFISASLFASVHSVGHDQENILYCNQNLGMVFEDCVSTRSVAMHLFASLLGLLMACLVAVHLFYLVVRTHQLCGRTSCIIIIRWHAS